MAKRRSIEQLAQIVVEKCSWSTVDGSAVLTDFAPLVVVMYLVARTIGPKRLRTSPKARQVWCRSMELLQQHDGLCLEHNTWLPCRYCDQAFDPVIDQELCTLFLAWHNSDANEDLLAIYQCPTCGGKLKALQTKRYTEDMYTPQPGSIKEDALWVMELLQHTPLY